MIAKKMTAKLPNSTQIPVKGLRLNFLWPLVLRDDPTGWQDSLRELLTAENWVDLEGADLIPTKETSRYEEMVYFHDFVRDFLYQPEDKPGCLTTYYRQDLTIFAPLIGDSFEDAEDAGFVDFKIHHCALHVFDTGVVVLDLNLELLNKASLARVLTIIDHVRRAYAPFWGGKKPGLSPHEVKINGQEMGLGLLCDRKTALEATTKNNREPMFPWWEKLIYPLPVEGTEHATSTLSFRQVLDERIPVMSTVKVGPDGNTADLQQIEPGDWHRLAGLDSAGSNEFPYNPCFLKKGVYFYDRFAPSKQGDQNGATRFLIAGYHFGAVGSGWFFDNLVTEHMLRHYRQMYLIALHEMAAMLRISSQISAAAKNNAQAVKQNMAQIEEDFLRFNNLYRFTGVSNQLQAREIFNQLRDSLELNELYRDVKDELDASARLVRTDQAIQAAAEQDQFSKIMSMLTEVATLALVLTVVSGLFGMNVFVEHLEEGIARLLDLKCKDGLHDIECFKPSGELALDGLLFFGLLSLISFLAILLTNPARESLRIDEKSLKMQGLLRWMCGVSFVLSIICAGFFAGSY